MKKLVQYIPVLLILLGLLIFLFGPQYAISHISQQQRARMSDFDWIGSEWIAAGILAMLFGAAWQMIRVVRRRLSADR